MERFAICLAFCFFATSASGQEDNTVASPDSIFFSYAIKGEYDKAISEFTKRIGLDPENAGLYVYRGLCWAVKRESEKAIADYNKAIQLKPNYVSAYLYRGVIWEKNGESKKALADYNKAIMLDPNSVSAHLFRGHYWEEIGEDEKALADYKAVLGFDSCHERAYEALGKFWEKKGKFDKAITYFTSEIGEYSGLRYSRQLEGLPIPTLGDAFTHRGVVWAKKNEYNKAIADLSEATKYNPKNVIALNQLSWLLATCPEAKQRNGVLGVKLARKSCELTKWKDHEKIITLAAAYAETGEFKNAIHWLKKAMEQSPNSHREARQKMMKLFEANKPYRSK